VIERTHTKKGDQKIVEVMDTIGIDLNDKNVLLVDSEIYTGDTMQAVTEFLRKKYPRIRMKTMVIFKSVMARFDVDYFAYKIKGYKVMPWVYRKEYMLAYHPPEK
jgi:hypoxanthine phosphoribosyltransferase